MAVAAWAASTAFSVGDIRRATTEQASGLFSGVRLLERQLRLNPAGQRILAAQSLITPVSGLRLLLRMKSCQRSTPAQLLSCLK